MSRSVIVQKYKVIVDGTELPDVISVAGIGLGEEGTVEASEVDQKVDVSDGVRKIDPVTIKIQKKKGLKTFKFMKDWWDNRATAYKDVSIAIWDKLMTEELHRYFYAECEIKSWKEEDQEQASPKVGTVECILLPYGAELVE